MNLYDILTNEDVVSSINDNLDYLLDLIPEIKSMIGFLHNHPHHHLDVWNHTLLSLSKSKNDFDIRLVLLLHDIGKPFSYQEENGIRHFKGHPVKSSIMAREILNRLNYDREYIDKICFYIENHDNEITNEFIKNNYDKALILYEIQRCDALSHNPEKLEKRKLYLSKIDNKLKNEVKGVI